jgi:hypothetical protein
MAGGLEGEPEGELVVTMGGLPLPWRNGQGADFNASALISQLEGDNPARGSAQHDLLTALRHAGSRADDDPWRAPYHVRYAQAVLEIAVEWSMPVVERWAVAWLMAAGGAHLRLRWSSRSRDGKVRRDGRTPAPVSALASGKDRVIIGCRSGYLASWTSDAGLREITKSADWPIWAIAARDGYIFAAGRHAHFLTAPADWVLPSPSEVWAGGQGITAAAIGEGQIVACGTDWGQVLVCPPDGNWTSLPALDGNRISLLAPGGSVLALSFPAPSTLRAVWSGGWIAESAPPWTGWSSPGRRRLELTDSPELPEPGPIGAAAFDETGWRLAIITGGTVAVAQWPEVHLRESWSHPGARAVIWSTDGLLASSGGRTLRIGEPGEPGEPGSISDETAGGWVAFLSADHVVTADDLDVVQWAVREAGSEVPDADSEDIVTAIAVDPRQPRCTMAGTERGRLRRYDGRGSPASLYSGPAINGQVHQLAHLGEEWLIAAHSGSYRWAPPPGSVPTRLSDPSRLCWAVAASGTDGAFAAYDQVFMLSGGPPLTFGAAVRDICFGPDGSIAAIDDRGTLRVRDPSGAEWDSPPRFPADGGWRLLAVDGQSVLVWSSRGRPWNPSGEVRSISRYQEDRTLAELPAGTATVLRFAGSRLVVVRPGQGVGLLGTDAEPGQAAPVIGAATRVTTAITDGSRVVVAAGKRVAGYDLLESAEAGGRGALALGVATLPTGEVRVTLPGGAETRLSSKDLAALGGTPVRGGDEPDRAELAGLTTGEILERATRLAVARQSIQVSAAGDIGDQIWQTGLDLAVDQARGDNPFRPVRLEWECDASADDVPWELIHPSDAPLGWFADPPITTVRSVRPRHPRPQIPASPRGPLARHRMLVIRGVYRELGSSDEAYARSLRRTRHSNVSALTGKPQIIDHPDDLDRALPESVDILQLWAHCGPEDVRFSPRSVFGTAVLADRLARCAPRLVVLVGCRSGALGRALVERGVEAVVAMRVEVFSQTIQPLVADLVSLAVEGVPIDLAFAEALHSYVLTGQPGAVAVPMLYLAEGSDGGLFSVTYPAVSTPHFRGERS